MRTIPTVSFEIDTVFEQEAQGGRPAPRDGRSEKRERDGDGGDGVEQDRPEEGKAG